MEISDMHVTKVIKTTTENVMYKVIIEKGSHKVIWESPNPLGLNYGDELKINVEKINGDLSKYEENSNE